MWRNRSQTVTSPKIRFRDPQIEMAHGAGGKASRRLVEGLFAPLCSEPRPDRWATPRIVNLNGTRIAMTTDSFVVKPLRFPGGSIGELAVNGTVNDLAVSGAQAEALVVTLRSGGGAADGHSGSGSARHGARPRGAPEWSSPAAIRKSSSTAKPTACTSPPPESAG